MVTFQLEVSDAAAQSIRRRKLNRDEVLFTGGSDVECIYRVVRGVIRVVTYPDGGKPLVLYRATCGETLAEDHLFSDCYRYSAIAVEKSIVASISRAVLVKELRAAPDQLCCYLACLCSRINQLQMNFQRIAIPDARTRVLNLLRNLVSPHDGHARVDLKGRIKSYADDLNLSHEAMYRALRKLEAEGSIVRQDDGAVRVNRDS